MQKDPKRLKVIELFAGVGGFRLGLEKAKGGFDIVWSNQWEPSTKTQHASQVYEKNFGGDNHINESIEEVSIETIPDHDLIVGGFPCQDYSVASTLKNSKGLLGKKGVLWWAIYKILSEKENKPKYLFLENVDRLLKSPVKQRGRDFAVMLSSLAKQGYAVEWRVINAADYGMPQRRRRVFFLGYHKSTKIYKELKKKFGEDWIRNSSVITTAFPINKDTENYGTFSIEGDLKDVSDNFVFKKGVSFENTGLFLDGTVITFKTKPKFKGKRINLGDIIEKGKVGEEFYISEKELEKWNYHKGAKKEIRKTSDGYEYHYSEGGMVFPDTLNAPSRTIITGEGGKSPSRFKHVIRTEHGLRRLTPVELERLNMFPDNHTKLEGISDARRAFFMGNALVVGVIEKIGKSLIKKIKELES